MSAVIPKLSAPPFDKVLDDTTKQSFMVSTAIPSWAMANCSSTERHDFLNNWSLKIFGTALFGCFQLWILGQNRFYCICSLHHSRPCCLWAFTPTSDPSLLPSAQFSPPSPSRSTSWKPKLTCPSCVCLQHHEPNVHTTPGPWSQYWRFSSLTPALEGGRLGSKWYTAVFPGPPTGGTRVSAGE